jgi:alpha-1,3-mannosyltransferase
VPQLPLADDATVVFSNDVAACAEDFLELVHQRRAQGADMACAMDWSHPGDDPLFYDVWVSRALNGDLFFDIPADTGGWDNATDLFWNEPVARARLAQGVPFQVFACWNGATAFTAAPLVKNEVAFRAPVEGECFQGEPQLFCKDMWFKGYGKIMVVPSVNLEYTDALGRKTKEQKGYVEDWVADENGGGGNSTTALAVPWRLEAPEMVKCMPTFNMQSWMPWNESLPLPLSS